MKFVNKNKVKSLLEKGAVIIDMRTPIQYRDGTYQSAKNLPLSNFINSILKFDKNKPLILIVNSVEDSDLKVVDTYANQLAYEKIYVAEYSQLKD